MGWLGRGWSFSIGFHATGFRAPNLPHTAISALPKRSFMTRSATNNRPAIIDAFADFVHSEVASSVVLLFASVVALAWANSPWADSYFHLLHTPIGLSFGEHQFELSLHHWINDGLMVVFFFVVGLEIKRELVVGHLSSMRQAMLPVVAAAGGMLLPACFYAALNHSGPGAPGWGIPTATDIAFALGVLALLGSRVPIGLKVYLTAVAIADDIGAVLIIALFYTDQISWLGLAIAGVFLVLLFLAIGVLHWRTPGILAILVIGVWIGVFVSGIHATIAGILIAFLVPVRGRIDPGEFLQLAQVRLEVLNESELSRESMIGDRDQLSTIEELHDAVADLRPPSLSLEQYFHPISAFVVLPLFALANAGVAFSGDKFALIGSPVTWGILLGLVFGKQIGISLFTWIIVRSGGASLPEGVKWGQIYGASCLAGIGFTMALFVSGLAFDDEMLMNASKLGILTASLVSAAIGSAVLHKVLPRRT
jgi:Na+:H+ antiporter, NhaA family